MAEPKVQVFIITRNRPDDLKKSLCSVMKQDFEELDIIVSDNSTNDETYKMLEAEEYKGVKCIRRQPQLDSSIDHMNAIHDEATSEYYMIFHDDDEMLPMMVRKLYEAIRVSEGFSAAASNAYFVKGRRAKMGFKRNDAILKDGEQLITRYNEKTIAPFPSYMYHKSVVGNIRLNKEQKGGKYSDVSFLFDIANRGPIAYVGTPLMNYNIHEGQDSANYDFPKRMQLVNYLLRNITDKARLTDFRLYSIYRNIVNDYKDGVILYRPQVVRLFIKHSTYSYLVKYLVRLIQNRLRLCTK